MSIMNIMFKFVSKFTIRLTLLSIAFIAGVGFALANSVRVSSFSPEPFDLTAATNPQYDLNGNACALVKINFTSDPTEVKITNNVITQNFDGSEHQAYITPGTKTIEIRVNGCSPLKMIFSDYGVYRLLSKQVYNLTLQIDYSSDSTDGTLFSAPSIYEQLEDPDDEFIDRIVEKANALYANGKESEAIPLLHKAASLGHTEALLSLGLLYEKGVGTKENWILKPNASKAFINVQNSAQQGYAPAQNVLSRYYLTGVGVDADKSLAELWKTLYEKNNDVQHSKEESAEIFIGVEQLAEYPGGMKNLMKDLSNYIVYPSSLQQKGIEAKVTLKFVVEKDGSINNIQVVKTSCYRIKEHKKKNGQVIKKQKAISGEEEAFEQASIEAVKKLSNFYPAKNNGIRVSSYYTLPITFQLKND